MRERVAREQKRINVEDGGVGEAEVIAFASMIIEKGCMKRGAAGKPAPLLIVRSNDRHQILMFSSLIRSP
jgi:hypothetical protein